MVAAHESSIGALRMSSDRPKIIKLHGDFLYDNIKNTLSELETLETNTKNKLTQIAQESGLVVVGYGGRDRSVMDVLEVLLRSDHYFPHGVYWCVRPDTTPSKRLESLLRRDRIHLVEVDGFDELMASIHGVAQFDLPQPLAAPLKVAADRAKLFINIADNLKTHAIISRDMACVLAEMDRASLASDLPNTLQAVIAKAKGNFDAAIRLWKAELEKNPRDEKAIGEVAPLLLSAGRSEELIAILRQTPDSFTNKTFLLLQAKAYEDVVETATQRLQQGPTDWVPRINRAIAYHRTGRSGLMAEDLSVLESDTSQDPRVRVLIMSGVTALRGDIEGVKKWAAEAIAAGTLSKRSFSEFPVFDEIRDNPDIVASLSDAFSRKENSTTHADSRVSPAVEHQRSLESVPAKAGRSEPTALPISSTHPKTGENPVVIDAQRSDNDGIFVKAEAEEPGTTG